MIPFARRRALANEKASIHTGEFLYVEGGPMSELTASFYIQKDLCDSRGLWLFSFAERQGFEPWIPEGITVFETAPIDHSGISPIGRTQKIYIFRPAKIRIKLKKQKFFLKFSRSTKPTSTLCSRLLEFAKIQNFSNHPSQPPQTTPICKEQSFVSMLIFGKVWRKFVEH